MAVQILLSTGFLLVVLSCALRLPAGESARGAVSDLLDKHAVTVFSVVLAAGLVLRLLLGYSINGFEADIACFKAWGM